MFAKGIVLFPINKGKTSGLFSEFAFAALCNISLLLSVFNSRKFINTPGFSFSNLEILVLIHPKALPEIVLLGISQRVITPCHFVESSNSLPSNLPLSIENKKKGAINRYSNKTKHKKR